MKVLLRLAHWIDCLNERIGHLTGWLALLMILVGAYNTVVRYLGRWLGGNLSSNAYIELQWYLFSLVFLLGAAHAFRIGAHVRVDLLYSRLSDRGRIWIDLVGNVMMLLPFCVATLWVSWPSVRNSWQVWEISPDPDGLPRYPIKAMILVAFVLLILQGLADTVKKIAILRGLLDPLQEDQEGNL
jgi:TRAP-type mannitol/chloroaromatic compound transport system permease small subunit